MATSPVAQPQPTLEQKIEQATAEAAQLVSIFAPAAGQAVAAGVAVEPLIFMFADLIKNLFHHHTKQAVAQAAAAAV